MNPTYSGAYESSYNASIDSDAAASLGLFVFGSMFIFIFFVAFIVYAYMAICLMKIAKKTGTENAWFAWVPILNVVLMLQIAKKPIWWLVFLFIPIVNIIWIVLSVLVWMAISERLGKPSWLGILMIVPVANLVVPGILAFSKSDASA